MREKLIVRLVFVIVALQLTLVSMGQIKNAKPYLAVGDIKVTMLQDAQINLPIAVLSGIENNTALELVGGNEQVLTSVNAFLVQTANHTVLVDAGIGKNNGENTGHLLEYLKSAGIDSSMVDLILITHFHFDHIGGLTSSDGKRMFPNAVVRVSKAENDFWMRDSTLMPENLSAAAVAIKAILAPYILAKAYVPFLPNEDLGDGITPLSANGHTPGHTVFAFSSKGSELWCVGDLIHFGDIQFSHPLVSIVFDSNSEMAISSRLDFFKRAALNHTIIAASHLPEILSLEIDGDAFITKIVGDR